MNTAFWTESRYRVAGFAGILLVWLIQVRSPGGQESNAGTFHWCRDVAVAKRYWR